MPISRGKIAVTSTTTTATIVIEIRIPISPFATATLRQWLLSIVILFLLGLFRIVRLLVLVRRLLFLRPIGIVLFVGPSLQHQSIIGPFGGQNASSVGDGSQPLVHDVPFALRQCVVVPRLSFGWRIIALLGVVVFGSSRNSLKRILKGLKEIKGIVTTTLIGTRHGTIRIRFLLDNHIHTAISVSRHNFVAALFHLCYNFISNEPVQDEIRGRNKEVIGRSATFGKDDGCRCCCCRPPTKLSDARWSALLDVSFDSTWRLTGKHWGVTQGNGRCVCPL
jgi:hypothetical protein